MRFGEHFQNAPVIFVTYTTTNQLTICEKIRKRFGFIPTQIKIMGWYQFLLDISYCRIKQMFYRN